MAGVGLLMQIHRPAFDLNMPLPLLSAWILACDLSVLVHTNTTVDFVAVGCVCVRIAGGKYSASVAVMLPRSSSTFIF